MKKETIFSVVLSLVAMTLFGCGGGGGGGAATPAPVAGSTTLSGVAAKGPINGGVVKAYAIKDGKVDRTAEIGSGTTDGSGNYKVIILPDKKPAGAVLVEVTSGSFTDEASGAVVTLKTPLQAVVSSVADGAKIAITPFTHLAVKQVEGIGAFTAQEIDDANKQIGLFFQVADIIKSQPFDPTKDAPVGVSDDEKKYAGALGAFSQLLDRRRGATNLEDALAGILDDLGQELIANGGFTGITLDDFNKSIDDFNISGKNRSGTSLTPTVFTAGVLQLQTTGSLPANTVIEGLDFTVHIPAGVTFTFDATTGEAANGVVAPVSNAATGSLVSAKFNTTTRDLHIILINVKPGIAVGEFAHLEFTLDTGTPLPVKADFAVTVNRIDGGNSLDPSASFIDLKAGGITITTKSVSGL